MAPKLKNLAADLAFKTRYEGGGSNHHRYAERHRSDGDADHYAGKVFSPRKGEAAGNEKREVQKKNIEWPKVGKTALSWVSLT